MEVDYPPTGSTETAPPKPQSNRSLSCHVPVSHGLLHTPGAMV